MAFRSRGVWRALRGQAFPGAYSFFDAGAPAARVLGSPGKAGEIQVEILAVDGAKKYFHHIGFFKTLDEARFCRPGILRIRHGKAVFIQVSIPAGFR